MRSSLCFVLFCSARTVYAYQSFDFVAIRTAGAVTCSIPGIYYIYLWSIFLPLTLRYRVLTVEYVTLVSTPFLTVAGCDIGVYPRHCCLGCTILLSLQQAFRPISVTPRQRLPYRPLYQFVFRLLNMPIPISLPPACWAFGVAFGFAISTRQAGPRIWLNSVARSVMHGRSC